MQLTVAAIFLAGLATHASAGKKAASESEVKAEFIERFTHFIDWPPSAFATPTSPFAVCLWGDGPLTESLEHVMARGRIQGRPAQTLHVGPRDRLERCHILYVADASRTTLRGLVARTRGRPILSVGDHPGFAEEGLLVNLYLDDGAFVRFEINRGVAEDSGLKVSAKLMRLARLVEPRR